MLGAKCSWKLLLKLSFQFETFLRIFHAWWEVFKIELNPAFETVWQINIQASQIYLTFNFRQTFLILWTTNRQTKIYLYLKVSIQSLPKDLHNSVRQTSWKFKILPHCLQTTWWYKTSDVLWTFVFASYAQLKVFEA